MRLDVFLSDSLLIKRRTISKEACDRGMVLVDGLKAKPSKEIQIGQKVRLQFPHRTLEIEILQLPKGNIKKQEVKNLYKILFEEIKKTDWLEE